MTMVSKAAQEPVVDDDAFDLDALVNESTKKPFTFKIDGKAFTLVDPMERDWKVIEELEEYAAGNRLKPVFEILLLDRKQYDAFLKLTMPTWKLIELLGAWQRHFGVSLGGSPASPQRSARTRRR
jgi:hypothetical protein